MRSSDRPVGQLAEALGPAQPALSKHLRVLREQGFVACRTVAQLRVYRLEAPPPRALDGRLEGHRPLWTDIGDRA